MAERDASIDGSWALWLKPFCGTARHTFENTEAERGPPMMSQNSLRNTTARDKLSWTNLEAIRRRWTGNLVIKGLVTPADVERSRALRGRRRHPVDARRAAARPRIAPLDVLPEIAASKGDLKIIIDSGIRRGTDVLKALALGADFVLLGRPFMFAAAIGGVPGVAHAIRLLKEEIDRDMALTGVTRLSELGPDFVRRVGRR